MSQKITSTAAVNRGHNGSITCKTKSYILCMTSYPFKAVEVATLNIQKEHFDVNNIICHAYYVACTDFAFLLTHTLHSY